MADAKITVSVTLASVYEVKKPHSFTQRLQNTRIHILIDFCGLIFTDASPDAGSFDNTISWLYTF